MVKGVYCRKTADSIGVIWGGRSGGPRYHVLDGVQVPHRKDKFKGEIGRHDVSHRENVASTICKNG